MSVLDVSCYCRLQKGFPFSTSTGLPLLLLLELTICFCSYGIHAKKENKDARQTGLYTHVNIRAECVLEKQLWWRGILWHRPPPPPLPLWAPLPIPAVHSTAVKRIKKRERKEKETENPQPANWKLFGLPLESSCHVFSSSFHVPRFSSGRIGSSSF